MAAMSPLRYLPELKYMTALQNKKTASRNKKKYFNSFLILRRNCSLQHFEQKTGTFFMLTLALLLYCLSGAGKISVL